MKTHWNPYPSIRTHTTEKSSVGKKKNKDQVILFYFKKKVDLKLKPVDQKREILVYAKVLGGNVELEVWTWWI